MGQMKLFATALGATLGLCAHLGVMAQSVAGISSDNKTVLVGVVAPLSGPVAYAGRATLASMTMYIDYVNKELGGVNGRQIKLLPEDDSYDPGKTVSAVRKLVAVDKVMAIAPIIGTANILAVRGYLNSEKVVAFNGISADPFKGNWPYLFGLGTPYEIEGAIAIEYIANELGAKKAGDTVYAVLPDDAFGKSEANGLEPAAAAVGIKLIIEKLPRTADQFGSTVTNIKRSGAKFVIVGQQRTATAGLMREAEAQGLDVTFVSPNTATTEGSIFDLAGKRYGEHYYGVHSVSLWEDESDPLVKWARDRFRAAGNTDALKERNFFYVWGLIVAKTVVEGIKRAGPDITREKLAEALHNMDKFDLGGGVAPVTYKGQTMLITGRMAGVSKGVLVNDAVTLRAVGPQRAAKVAIDLEK